MNPSTPLPPPPRRPPPAQLPVPSPRTAASMPLSPSASATSSSRSGHFLRTRALNKASQLWTQSSDYLAPRLESASDGISRGIADLRERRDWETPNGLLTTPKGILTRARPGSLEVPPVASSSSATQDERSEVAGADMKQGGSRWGLGAIGAVTGYFAAGAREKRDQNFYSEEKIVCFPGYGTLRPSAHAATEPAMVIDILSHGYAYRLRPISQASRSQRVFYSLAKSFAALPKVPTAAGAAGQLEEGGMSVDSLASMGSSLNLNLDGSGADAGNVFEQLVELGEREAERDGQKEKEREKTDEPAEFEEAESLNSPVERLPDEPPLSDAPARIARRPRITTNTSTSSLPQVTRASRPSSIHSRPNSPTTKSSSTSSAYNKRPAPPIPPKKAASLAYRSPTSPTTSGSSTPLSHSRSSSLTSTSTLPHDTHYTFPRPFSYTSADLPRLHENLQSRLVPFFGQKLSNRKVRLSIYPSLPSGQLTDAPLATKVVTTGNGGGFKTNISVMSRDLRKLLDVSGAGVESLDGMRVRVVAELLENDPVGDLISGGHFLGHQGLRKTAEDESEFLVGVDGGVRVISDIDDTIKWTEVLGGSKNIFRNVFVRELDEIRVPGMAKWYNAMEDLGAHFHYVSNSPWELWPVIRAYLVNAGFPLGSVTLKEYGGASSAIAKLWEEPGMRKRAGVETIIKEFPDCRFILVGDSGEQDMNLYVALAQVYPSRVLAIYIRDVTTPLPSSGAPPSSSSSTHSVPPAAPLHSFSETPDLPGQFDGSHESLPPPFARSDTTLVDPDVDALSPNNPLRSMDSGGGPDGTEGQKAKEDLVEAFYKRISEAEKVLPKGIPLRIFRRGEECEEEAVAFVREWRR